MKRLLTAASLALALAACNDQYASSGKSLAPIPPQTMALMSEKGMTRSDPILVRLYKKESELEVWKKAADGKYAVLKTFPICRWSGQLGPKRKEGDRQAPEGFYSISPGQMNPNSAYYLSFDTGYPNAFDRAHGGTGAQLMVHGTCSSRGCYAMTDEGISEVYSLAREAFANGQKNFQFQAYPFRMTAENLAKYRADPNMLFWKNLKEGADHFEITGREPKVAVCGGRYAFDTVGGDCKPDPTLAPAVAEKQHEDDAKVAELVAKGTPAVRLVYADGGQHESFRRVATNSWSETTRLGEVSRPEALAEGPREVPVENVGTRAKPTLVAAAKPSVGTRLATASKSTTAVPASGPARTVIASADPDMPIVAAQSVEPEGEKPFYKRMLGGVFGSGEPAKTIATPQTEQPEPAVAVMPPHRKAASAKPNGTAPVSGKSTTPAIPPARHVDASGVMSGGQPLGPTAGMFAKN